MSFSETISPLIGRWALAWFYLTGALHAAHAWSEVTEAMACQLMVGIALNMRMLAYGVEVDNPSSGGLKLDLDRFRQEFEDIVRDAKNGADGFIETIKSALATDDARTTVTR